MATERVDGEARRRLVALLLGGSGVNFEDLIARRLLACLLGSGCLLLGGGGGLRHVVLVAVVDVGVVGGVLVVVVVVVELVVVTVVVVVVVCNLESAGRNVSNSVLNMKRITKSLKLAQKKSDNENNTDKKVMIEEDRKKVE